MIPIFRLTIALPLVLVLAACGETDEGATPAPVTPIVRPVATVRIEGSRSNLLPTETVTLVATAFDRDASLLTGRDVTWRSSSADIASVSREGLVTAIAPGSATIAAEIEGVSGSFSVVVIQTATSVQIAFPSPALFIGEALSPSITVKGPDGSLLTGRPVIWTSSRPFVATVNAGGSVVGILDGLTSIRATVDGKSDSVELQVARPVAVVYPIFDGIMWPGDTLVARVDARDMYRFQTPASLLRTIWTSSAPQVATVSPTGIIKAIADGATTITATSGDASGSSLLHVMPGKPNYRILISNEPFLPKQTRKASIELRLDDGSYMSPAPQMIWTSSDPRIATVDSAGVVTAMSPGIVTITASRQGRSTSAAVSIVPPAYRVRFTIPDRVKAGEEYPLSVSVDDGDGNFTSRIATWSVEQRSVGAIGLNGALHPIRAGQLTVGALIDGTLWKHEVTVYDWVQSDYGSGISVSLEADSAITLSNNKKEYARLAFNCSTAGIFSAYVTIPGIALANANVDIAFDYPGFRGTWLISPFDAIVLRGNNAEAKNFANYVAGSSKVRFTVNTTNQQKLTLPFRVTNASSKLGILYQTCPSYVLESPPAG